MSEARTHETQSGYRYGFRNKAQQDIGMCAFRFANFAHLSN